jgi:DNA-binding NarL/FixJ family response regulator
VNDLMPLNRQNERVRLLVVARRPFQVDELELGARGEVESFRVVRRVNQIETAVAESNPNVVLIDAGFPEGRGFEAIGQLIALATGAGVLALTPDPPPPDHVARAVRAGAVGFLDVNAEPDEFAAALTAAAKGGTWFPDEEVRGVLSAVADDLDTTSAERRSRMTGILIGLIPVTGVIAALLTFMWRKYLGQIGVRPVDLAIDPASRVVDAVVNLSLVFGVFGPLLFVGTWLDMLRGSGADRGPIGWLLEKPKTAHIITSVGVLAVTGLMAIGQDLFLVMVIGPTVAVAVTARAADFTDELPRFLRLEKIRPRRMLVGAGAVLVLFMALLAGESLLAGPDLGTRGEGGWIAPRVLGFNAQPMQAFDVDTGGEPRERLYLGGNADLYVLVDPCNDDTVELVSVGSTRLVVIDEITCSGP